MKKFFLSLSIIVLLGAVAGMIFVYAYGTQRFSSAVADQVLERLPTLTTSSSTLVVSESEVLKDFFGFTSVKTYLILFLNNTELRPGGGFIGAYAIVRVDKARFSLLKVEGTEILDNYAPSFVAEPPAPLKKYVLVDRWNFRDANWSPDFALSSQKALELYHKEGGLAAKDINAVIGITPTVLEGVLGITGPITVDGQTFNRTNFTERLEYQVEKGFLEQGKTALERKDILGDLGKVLESRLKTDLFKHWSAYWALARRMLGEKQVMVYSTNPDTQTKVAALGWSGEMTPVTGDYLLYADANLAALKTDAVMKRSIAYTITPTSSGRFVAEVAMRYEHTGKINWRISRYRSYARVFVPAGSKLVDVVGGVAKTPIDQGIEASRQWFGTLVDVAPGAQADLRFKYYVAPTVAAQIQQGDYALSIQKQLGTNGVGLTLGLNFGRPVVAAHPGEPSELHEDNRYDLHTDLSVDRQFDVSLKH